MEYSVEYTVKDEHIDVQGIMDGLYYPFYMEECRHNFAKEVLGIDLEAEAKKGVNIVLTEYTMKFLRSLKKGDTFNVTCEAYKSETHNTKFYMKQFIMVGNKKYTEAIFTVAGASAATGRPFMPDYIQNTIAELPVL